MIFGIIGLLIAASAIWVKNERRQDLFFLAGSICFLIYSISIKDKIFIILQVIFIISVSAEMLKLRKNKNGSQK